MLGRVPAGFMETGKDVWQFFKEGKVFVRPVFYHELLSQYGGVDYIVAPSPADSLLASDLTTYARSDPPYPGMYF